MNSQVLHRENTEILVDRRKELSLLQTWQNMGKKALIDREVVTRGVTEWKSWVIEMHSAKWQEAVKIVILVQRNANLAQMFAALNLSRRFPCSLNRRQQQTNENGNQHNDDQQFNQCECFPP